MPPFEKEAWIGSRELTRKAKNLQRIRGSHPRGPGSIPGLGTNVGTEVVGYCRSPY